MKTAKLTQVLSAMEAEAFAALPAGQWTNDDYRKAFDAKLVDVDLNDYRDEIIAEHIKQAEARRAKTQPFFVDDQGNCQLELFTEDVARNGIIRLGRTEDGVGAQRVRMFDATFQHWLTHQETQIKKAQDTTKRAAETTNFLVRSEAGAYLRMHQGAPTSEAMRAINLWPDPESSDA